MGLLDLLRPKAKIADIAGLTDFLDRQSAFMVQKCIYEYARARSGLLSVKLLEEPAFRAAAERSKWRNYPLCLQSAALMVEGALREESQRPDSMRAGLAEVVARICRLYPPPPEMPAHFWDEVRRDVAERLDRAGREPPQPVKDIPQETARAFFANLPIHADLRGYDFTLVTNNLRGNLCRAYDTFLATADRPALVRALAAEAA